MHLQGLAGRRKETILWPKYLGHFFILPYFPMAEPCCDTSSFSIDVVLASHQIKHSYALLLVYIYIHNVFPSLILSFYLGSASCTPFLTQPFCLPFSHLITLCFGFGNDPWMRHFCQSFKVLGPSSGMESLEAQADAWGSCGESVQNTTDAGTLLALESSRHLSLLAALSIKSLSMELYKRPFKGYNLGSVCINCHKVVKKQVGAFSRKMLCPEVEVTHGVVQFRS